jgi:endonuclease I
MEKIELKPCKICIDNLREKLFKIKTTCNLIPYNRVKEFIQKKLVDLYTGPNKIQNITYNIEHVIPANIIAPRPTRDDIFFINKEPYHDVHLLFPTVSGVNSLRENLPYGIISNNRENIEQMNKSIGSKPIIINGIHLYSSDKQLAKQNKLDPIELKDLVDLKPNLDIYIHNNVFQPPAEYVGCIARIVFYFYLMYAYDFSVRPYKNIIPWFAHVKDNRNCKGFDKEKWDKFFLEHLSDYYNWAKNNNISDMETDRNKKIIQKFKVPNIFMGYYQVISNDSGEKKSQYVISDFDMILDLLFGKEHLHDKYTNIIFSCDSEHINVDNCDCKINRIQIEPIVRKNIKIEENILDESILEKNRKNEICRYKIISQNLLSKSIQEVKPIKEEPILMSQNNSLSGGMKLHYYYKYIKYMKKNQKIKLNI